MGHKAAFHQGKFSCLEALRERDSTKLILLFLTVKFTRALNNRVGDLPIFPGQSQTPRDIAHPLFAIYRVAISKRIAVQRQILRHVVTVDTGKQVPLPTIVVGHVITATGAWRQNRNAG